MTPKRQDTNDSAKDSVFGTVKKLLGFGKSSNPNEFDDQRGTIGSSFKGDDTFSKRESSVNSRFKKDPKNKAFKSKILLFCFKFMSNFL